MPARTQRAPHLRSLHRHIDDLAGTRYQPTLRITGKGDKPADIVLNPRTHQAIDLALDGRVNGPLLLNRAGRRMQRHNAAAIINRLRPI